jgi:nucleoside-diphosphate-sugar epimerase
MKILITGNQGYIGPVLAEYLKKNLNGSFIIGLDTGYFSNSSNSILVSPDKHVDVQINKDVRDLVSTDFTGIDSVVYLAAISNDPMGKEFELATHEINCEAAIKCAELAKLSGVKNFVFASSCSVYGAAGDGELRTEDSPLNPVTAYAQSKINAEIGLKLISDSSFNITCLRFSTACGYSSRIRLDLVLNDFIASAILKKEINILSDGTPWRPLIHVKDMARAIHWGIMRKSNLGGSFCTVNVGSEDWNYQIKDLAEMVAKLIPGVNVRINKDALPDKRSYKVSFKEFQKLAPQFIPKETLESTIREIERGILSYLEYNKNILESNTIRLIQIRSLIENDLLDKKLNWK